MIRVVNFKLQTRRLNAGSLCAGQAAKIGVCFFSPLFQLPAGKLLPVPCFWYASKKLVISTLAASGLCAGTASR